MVAFAPLMDLQQAINSAKPGDTLSVPAGTHFGSLVIDKPLTLKGEGPGKSILDARRAGACVLVNGDGAKVTLLGLTLQNGSSPQGGCVAFVRGDLLTLQDCLIEDGVCRAYGGGGVLLAGRAAKLSRVRITGCVGNQGGGVLVDDECEVELQGCAITGNAAEQGGGLRVKEAAKVKLVHCTLAENQGLGKTPLGPEILINGTMSRTPELAIVNSVIAPRAPSAEAVASLGQYAGKVTVAHSLLPESSKGKLEGPGVRYGAPEFFPSGAHRQKLGPSSPAAGTADPKATPAGLLDLLGKKLSRGTDADMGAYAAF